MALDEMEIRGRNDPLKTAEHTITEGDHEGSQKSGSNQDGIFLARAGKKQQMKVRAEYESIKSVDHKDLMCLDRGISGLYPLLLSP